MYTYCLLFCVWINWTFVGQDEEIFTSVLYNLYDPPKGFCFDEICKEEPIMDNPKLHGYNVDEKVINKHHKYNHTL